MNETIRNLYTKNLITINKESRLQDAEETMNNHNIRHLPVVDDSGELVGILSKSDFSALRFVQSGLIKFCVKDLMSSPVKVVSPFAKIKDIAKMFIDKKISSVLVVNQNEAIGILTSEDLIRLLLQKSELHHDFEDLDLNALAEEGWISSTYN